MVHTNKILTVSYGTFSCTLEGFDDAFGTMKAIAEYFRDLAADDRYFGAEPPQPDAEMLARIAQREVTRRVEAHQDATGVLLRATDAENTDVEVQDTAQAPAAPAAETKDVVSQPEPDAAPVAEPEPVATPDATLVAAMADNDLPDAVAPEDAVELETEVETLAVEDTVIDEAPAQTDPEQDIAAEAVPDDWNADLSPVADGEAPEDIAVSDPEMPEVETAAPAKMAPALVSTLAQVGDTMADKLAKIRAVVERNDAKAQTALSTDASQDFDDTFDADLSEPVNTSDAPRIEDAFDELAEIAAEVNAGDDEYDDNDALIDTVLDLAEPEDSAADIEANVFVEEPQAIADVAPIDVATESEAHDPAFDLSVNLPKIDDRTVIAPRPQTPARLSAAEEEAADNLFDTISDEPDVAPDEGDEVSDDSMIENILSDLEPEEDAASEPATASKPAARVIKVKRSDLEDAIASGTLEEVTDEEPNSSLSPEDEAELQAELDAVAAELAEAQAALNPPDAPEAEAAPQTKPAAPPARSGGAGKIEAAQPDLSRLMAEAASKMDEPESSSRREAYAHLRAAVAAAEAEESIGDSAARADEDAAYREDLASVVRPRRPDAAGGPERPRRLGHARPAPLKLVAEQRITADEILPQRAPIRPRRIAAEAEADAPVEQETEASTDHTAGFAAFAKEVGAKDLHELLEAAAAYLSFVEGRAQFSRPQLMTRVKQVNERGFNREDGLRTFGQLLREGKIEKTSGGRFTASEHIGFRPARKAAG